MLIYRLIRKNEGEYIYEYTPEGDMKSGIVSILIETGEIKIIKLSEDDETKYYIGMFFSKLRKFREENNFKEKGMVAWS